MTIWTLERLEHLRVRAADLRALISGTDPETDPVLVAEQVRQQAAAQHLGQDPGSDPTYDPTHDPYLHHGAEVAP